MRLVLSSFLSVLVMLAIAACDPSLEDLEAVAYMPLLVNDGWRVSTPEAEGLDPLLVAELYHKAAQMETLRALLVIMNGRLIAEDYFNDGAVDQKARLQSVTKSFTSALIGIAIGEGLVTGVDQRMLEFFPEIAGEITDPRKSEITIQQMLQMRAGYPWEETHADLWAGLLSGYYVPLIEDFPLTADPGTRFQYSNLTSDWLGIIIDRASGMRLKSFAEVHLFPALGIEPGEWGTDAEGHNNGCGDLHLTARDAAKFGLLYLNGGEYEGDRVLPAEWVDDSLRAYSTSVSSGAPSAGQIGRYFRDVGYGYQWWTARIGDHHVSYAAGHGGQLIVLLAEYDLVVVTTAYPFWLEHNAESWKHEKGCFDLVGEFIDSLP